MGVKQILVAGAGGFIGGFLVKRLVDEGNIVYAVDIKPLKDWYQIHNCFNFPNLDLKNFDNCNSLFIPTGRTEGIDEVYNLAADMGGMGFIENNKALCMLSVLINTNLLMTSKEAGVKRFFYASSACVYNGDKQQDSLNPGLKESDAYPALPEDGYGWEKLFSERMCRHFMEDFGLECRIARFHNVYGPLGTYKGGREKAPAAICRKVIESTGEIEIWGDGEQTRSFMYVDDCIEGVRRLMDSDIKIPLNIGSSEMVSINQLVDIAESFEDKELVRKYDLNAPKGVRGRSSDNTLIKELMNWEPSIRLVDGLKKTYDWIKEQENESNSHDNN